MNSRFVLWLFILGCLSAHIGNAQSDIFVGTWKLSRGKSDFEPPQNFFGRTMILESAGNGYRCVTRTVSDRRQTIESDYTASLDGKDAPILNSQLDTISLKRIDAVTLEATGKIKGQVIERSLVKVSADGKVLTMDTKGTMNGEDYHNTQVFNRQ